jgi:MFS family permease
LNKTGSGLLVSISQMITIASTVIVSPLAGVIGDRYNKKRLLVGSDIASGAVVAGMFALFNAGVTGLPFVFLCQALCAASECMLISSLFAIIPDIVSNRDITRANAMRGMGTSIALFVGPMLGGMVLGFLGMKSGMKYVFLINALSFLFSATLASFIKYGRRAPANTGEFSLNSFVSDLKEIMKYLKENASIRKIARFAVILNIASAPILYVVIPFLIVKVINMNSQQYGFIQGFYMAGFFIGGLLLSALKLKNTRRMVRPSLFVMSAATLLLSIISLPPVVGALGNMAAITVLIVMIGCGDSVSNTIVQSEIQSIARSDIISRVGGVLNMAFQASIPAGLLVVGLLIDHIPLYWVFIPIALFLLIFITFSSRGLFTGSEAR